jgi:hypothetical protein
LTLGQTTNYTWDVAAGLPVVLQDDDNTYVYGLDLISATDGATLSSDTGEVVSATWDASLLGTPDGSIVELKVVGHRSGGNPSKRCDGHLRALSRSHHTNRTDEALTKTAVATSLNGSPPSRPDSRPIRPTNTIAMPMNHGHTAFILLAARSFDVIFQVSFHKTMTSDAIPKDASKIQILCIAQILA